MTDQKKKKTLLKKLRDKYRLAIFNEQSYEELFVMRLSRLNVFTAAGTIAVLLVVLVTLLIAFTGLREYIPGYPDAQQRLLIVRNAQRVDSLLVEINKRDQFINSFKAILHGEMPDDSAPDDTAQPATNSVAPLPEFSRSEADSLLRAQAEREERFNLSARESPRRAVALESAFFVSPIKGMVRSEEHT